jgi:hypothetical protein
MFWNWSQASRLKKARAKLMSSEYAAREEGFNEINKLLEQGLDPKKVLSLVTDNYPYDEECTYESTSAKLLRALQAYCGTPGFIPALEAIYDDLVDKQGGREGAIYILMRADIQEGYRAAVRLLGRPTSRTVGQTHVNLVISLREAPREALCMFPGLFEVIPNLNGRESIYFVILNYLQAGVLSLHLYPSFITYCLERTTDILDRDCLGLDQNPSLEHRQQYLLAYLEIEHLLDVFRFIDDPRVVPLLQRALEQKPFFDDMAALENHRIKMFAVTSLLARGADIDPTFLERTAEVPALRWRLWQQLENVNRLDAFPLRYRDSALLAEAEMVMWLEHPNEMGRVPEELRQIAIFRYTDRDGHRQRMYLFRYRHPDFEAGAWLVGVAGPYRVDHPPGVGGRWTFSRLKAWESKSLEEHVRDYLREDETDLEIEATADGVNEPN